MNIKVLSGSQYPKFVIPLIESAKQSIDIIVFDWRWYANDPGASCQLFNSAIVQASKRKIKIRAIVNNDEIKNALNNNGIETKKLNTFKLVHCKLIIIDNKIVITGSHNYTESAFNLNLELSVILDEIDDIKPFADFYQNLWQQ